MYLSYLDCLPCKEVLKNICKSLAYSAEENVCFALLYLPKLVVSFKRKVLRYGLVLPNVPIF